MNKVPTQKKAKEEINKVGQIYGGRWFDFE